MSVETRRPKGVRIHTRRLMEEVRRDPDFERALPLLRQQIPNFDQAYGAHFGVLEDILLARKDIREKGSYEKLDALSKDYESPKGKNYNPDHPNILEEVAPATRIIVGIFKKR